MPRAAAISSRIISGSDKGSLRFSRTEPRLYHFAGRMAAYPSLLGANIRRRMAAAASIEARKPAQSGSLKLSAPSRH